MTFDVFLGIVLHSYIAAQSLPSPPIILVKLSKLLTASWARLGSFCLLGESASASIDPSQFLWFNLYQFDRYHHLLSVICFRR